MPSDEKYQNGGPGQVQTRVHRYYGAHFAKCMPGVDILMSTFEQRVKQIEVK